MTVPATSGVLRTRIQDMVIGDYIQANWNTSTQKWNQGDGGKSECPLAGIADASTPTNYYLYFIKVDKGFLIADRVWSNTISWDTLNTRKNIQGSSLSFVNSDSSEISIFQRSLAGGNAFSDANGHLSTVDLGLGAYPTNNEWDKYILFSDLNGHVSPDDINVWHHDIGAWAQDTVMNGITRPDGNTTLSINTSRIQRSIPDATYKSGISWVVSSTAATWVGFRPVFEYVE